MKKINYYFMTFMLIFFIMNSHNATTIDHVDNSIKLSPKIQDPFIFEPTEHIQSIDIENNKNFFETNGTLRIDGLMQLLQQAYAGKKLPDIFTSLEEFTATELIEQHEETWWTEQLFEISSPKQSFIIKSIKGEEKALQEVDYLWSASQLPPIKRFLYFHDDNNYPQFIFPIAFLSYEDHTQKKHYLSIIPKTKGISFFKLLKKFCFHQDDAQLRSTIAQAHYCAGASIAHFYTVSNGLIHGDFYINNIFFDPETQFISLIDCDRIMRSVVLKLDQREDLAFFLMKSLFLFIEARPELLEFVPKHNWYNLTVPAFLSGFLSVFPDASAKKARLEELIEGIKNYRDPKDNKLWYTDTTNMGFAHQEYLDPIFETFKKSHE